jgi:hypothetical protein
MTNATKTRTGWASDRSVRIATPTIHSKPAAGLTQRRVQQVEVVKYFKEQQREAVL